MDKRELLNKLAQIEEHARFTLDEFPLTLTKERQRMIIALARYIRTELSASTDMPPEVDDDDDSIVRSG